MHRCPNTLNMTWLKIMKRTAEVRAFELVGRLLLRCVSEVPLAEGPAWGWVAEAFWGLEETFRNPLWISSPLRGFCLGSKTLVSFGEDVVSWPFLRPLTAKAANKTLNFMKVFSWLFLAT